MQPVTYVKSISGKDESLIKHKYQKARSDIGFSPLFSIRRISKDKREQLLRHAQVKSSNRLLTIPYIYPGRTPQSNFQFSEKWRLLTLILYYLSTSPYIMAWSEYFSIHSVLFAGGDFWCQPRTSILAWSNVLN